MATQAEEEVPFLSRLELPGLWEPPEVLDLLREQRFKAAEDLVRSGEVPIKGLLHAAFFFGCASRRDLEILFAAAEKQGERLEDADLEAACLGSSPAAVELLLRKGLASSQEALHCAMRAPCGHDQVAERAMQMAQLLLDARATVDGHGTVEESPLVTACGSVASFSGQHFSPVVQWLLDKNADPCGAGGARAPVHALCAGFAGTSQVQQLLRDLLAQRADVNQRDFFGSTPLHYAIEGHVDFLLAKELVAMKADISLASPDGTVCDLLKKGCSYHGHLRAAELEGRELTPEEVAELQKAAGHPVAKQLEACTRGISWLIRSPAEGNVRLIDNLDDDDDDARICPEVNELLCDKLGCVPNLMVEDVEFIVTEKLTIRQLLGLVYDYYQDPLDMGQVRRIRRLRRMGLLGDTFGYLRRNIPEGEPAKEPQVPRIDLRGDSIFFEGFRNCTYLEEKKVLYGRMGLGS
ncbi:unnamed protein product [Effrenium voratum]|uniref:Ankyrin repeat protein n=1 Tax=Effrenium voratum TaxID=2562239 RepID=A0AA36J8E1_9DINO|nr:unnamed protein product [Effrenium voratum]